MHLNVTEMNGETVLCLFLSKCNFIHVLQARWLVNLKFLSCPSIKGSSGNLRCELTWKREERKRGQTELSFLGVKCWRGRSETSVHLRSEWATTETVLSFRTLVPLACDQKGRCCSVFLGVLCSTFLHTDLQLDTQTHTFFCWLLDIRCKVVHMCLSHCSTTHVDRIGESTVREGEEASEWGKKIWITQYFSYWVASQQERDIKEWEWK